MPFQKGNPGRPKGSKNKASLPWKEFVTALVLDPAVQAKLKEMALERPDLVFKAAEFAYGKPHQSISHEGKVDATMILDHDVAED